MIDYPKTLAELNAWPIDQEQILVNLVIKARVEHNTDTSFKSEYNVSYSYTTLCNRLKDRGWLYEWHKPNASNPVKKIVSDETSEKILTYDLIEKCEKSRMSLSVSKECQEKWTNFIEDKARRNEFVRTINEDALNEYMDRHQDTHFRFMTE